MTASNNNNKNNKKTLEERKTKALSMTQYKKELEFLFSNFKPVRPIIFANQLNKHEGNTTKVMEVLNERKNKVMEKRNNNNKGKIQMIVKQRKQQQQQKQHKQQRKQQKQQQKQQNRVVKAKELTKYPQVFEQLMEKVQPNRPILFARLTNKFEGNYDEIVNWINTKKERRNARKEKMMEKGRNMTEFKSTFDQIYSEVEPKRPIVFAKVVNKCNGDFNASLDLIEELRGRKNQQQQQQQRKVRVHIRKMIKRRPLLQQQRQPQHDIRQKCMDVELFDQLIQFYPNRPVVLMRLINRLDTQNEQVRLALNQFITQNNPNRHQQNLNLGKLGKFVKNHPRPRNQPNQRKQRQNNNNLQQRLNLT